MRARPLALLVALGIVASAGLPAGTHAQERAASASGAATGQSPVEVRREDLPHSPSRSLPALVFHYPSRVRLDVENTGSPRSVATERATVPQGAAGLRVGEHSYHLVQFHWHAPAEHVVNGVRHPMELHLVHHGADGGELVTAVFVREGGGKNGLEELFRTFPADSGAHVTVKDFNLRALLPRDLRSVRYTGSLTTPPFTEGVRWIVLTTPIALTHEEITEFRDRFPEGDAREVQPLAGRTLQTDDPRLTGGGSAPAHGARSPDTAKRGP